LIGSAWSVASIFIIPVIIREEKISNPLKLLKTSALIWKNTWGESVIGFEIIGSMLFFVLLAFLPVFILVLIYAGQLILGHWLMIIVLSLCFLSILVFCYLWIVINPIYQCALYVYASEGVIPGPYDEEMMNMCWKVKVA
jgi:hypothetical protein